MTFRRKDGTPTLTANYGRTQAWSGLHTISSKRKSRLCLRCWLMKAIGLFLGDRMLLTNVEAALSTEPDGMFISNDALHDDRVHLEQGGES